VKNYVYISVINITTLLLTWILLHIFFSLSFNDLIKIDDAPIYLEYAQTLNATHYFLGFPLYIRLFYSIVGDYLLASILCILVFSTLSTITFYMVINLYTNKPLALSLLFIFFPFFLFVNLYPMSDSSFLFFLFLSFYFLKKGKYEFTSLFLGIGCFIRLLGVLFTLGYLLMLYFWKEFNVRRMLLIFFSSTMFILLQLLINQLQTGDFFIYFKKHSREIGSLVDFLFNLHQYDLLPSVVHIVIPYVIYGLGIIVLWKNKHETLTLYLVHYLLLPLLSDNMAIGRYFLPLFPFFLIFDETFYSIKIQNYLKYLTTYRSQFILIYCVFCFALTLYYIELLFALGIY